MTKRGSEWAKWDLHLHSKYSQESRTSMEIEDIFRIAVEKQIKIISITDHSNVDALDEIWDVYENQSCDKGSYKDLIDFLPGIELKTDKGKKGVHIIAIFPKEITVEDSKKKTTKQILYDNFCSKLDLTQSKIEGRGNGSYETGLLRSPVSFDEAVKLTHELGGLVIIHGGDKHGSIENEMANPESYDADGLYKALDINKIDIMSKKIDLIELPNFNKGEAKNAKFYIKQFGKPCIVGSDAHELCEYNNLGEKATWIKANTTFDGLKQAIVDYENRIFLKEIPEHLEKVRKNPTKFLEQIKIEWNNDYDGNKGEWFKDVEIPLNTGLISIIGNKGNGKSAIAEIIAWVAENKKYNNFAFLNKSKFLKNKLASQFIGKLKWKSDNTFVEKNLAEEPDPNSIERVQSIPQQYFEEICTDTELEKFTNEINCVIFSRLSEEQRENESSLEDLIEKYSRVTNDKIKFFMNKLSDKNEEIIKLEYKQKDSYYKAQEAIFQDLTRKLEAHKEICPDKVDKPVLSESKQKEYDLTINKISDIKSQITNKEKSLSDLTIHNKNLDVLKNEINGIYERINLEKVNLKAKLDRYKINVDNIIKIELDSKELENLITICKNKIKEVNVELGDENGESGLKYELKIKEAQRAKIISEENNNIKRYDQYKKAYDEWEKEFKKKENELEIVKKEMEYIKTYIQADLNSLYSDRDLINKNIFLEKKKIVEIYNRFKNPIDEFLLEHKDLLNNYSISIRSGLIIYERFEEELFNYINKKRKNAFRDQQYVLNKTIEEYDEIENIDDYIKIPNLILEKMREYETELDEQVKDNKLLEFYNYVYGLSYISNKYELISDNKTLEKLSPGERGALLLIFYLLLDMRDIPLIIDQPEDNLDNQSVAKILVPFIQAARKRRQIIMVTHNPNLAVVADSDQIIHVKIDKERNHKVIVESGAIEELAINECLVTILEGTMPSFTKRKEKYM